MADDTRTTAEVLGALTRELNHEGVPHAVRDEIVLVAARQLIGDGFLSVRAASNV